MHDAVPLRRQKAQDVGGRLTRALYLEGRHIFTKEEIKDLLKGERIWLVNSLLLKA